MPSNNSNNHWESSINTFQSGSIRLAYQDVGKGPLVVLLHGFPDTADTWEETQQILKTAGYRSCALHLRGYSPSDIPKDGEYGLATLVADTMKLVEHLGYQECILVGHDWGAMITYAAAILHPEKVTAIVTLAIPPPKVSHANWRERLLRPHNVYLGWGQLAHWWVKRNKHSAIDFFYRQWSPNWRVPVQHMSRIKKAFALPDRTAAAVDYYAAPIGEKLASMINNPITQPALVLYGLDEPKVRLEMFSKAKSALSKGSVVIGFEGVGHWPHREQPEKFYKELLAFLQNLSVKL
ncbi:MAG: alpha/beta hydrolase [Pseudomonadales bacterium]|nr:alpha/beta hydrolase [Pseudomonadales bacterium]NRA14080.1 alpha/beta hydrolase [Oceanospirillaceae bacterium]